MGAGTTYWLLQRGKSGALTFAYLPIGIDRISFQREPLTGMHYQLPFLGVRSVARDTPALNFDDGHHWLKL